LPEPLIIFDAAERHDATPDAAAMAPYASARCKQPARLPVLRSGAADHMPLSRARCLRYGCAAIARAGVCAPQRHERGGCASSDFYGITRRALRRHAV